MSLNKEDSRKVGYQAKIEWYKKRFAAITSGELEESAEFSETTSTPDELISILGDLEKKSLKLDIRIDDESGGLRIPVDKEKQPDVANAVSGLDEESHGEYVSYDFYRRLVAQQEAAQENIGITDIIENTTGDPLSDSLLIQDRISSGLAKYNELTPPGDNSLERYANRYLNNIVSWNEHDYKIRQIINFSDNYLDMFPDPAYSPWRMKRDIRQKFVDVKSLGGFWQQFSTHFEDQANDLVGGIKGLTALKPDKNIHDITKRYIQYTNSFLDGVNEIFEMDYGADLICCFIRWSGSLDIKTLKGLRALLQLLQTGLSIDFGAILNSLVDIINNIFRGLLTNSLIGLVNQVHQRLVDPIKKWINDPDPRWQKIFTCTPVDELINKYVVYSIDYIERLLISLIENWYKQIEIDHLKSDLRLELVGEQKWIGNFIKMLDVLIASIERSAICGTESSPTGEEIQKLMSAYGVGPAEPYKYEKEEKPNIYNSFISKTPEEKEESLGGEFAAKKDTNIQTMGIGMTKKKFDECLKKFVPVDIVQVTDWFDEIKAKSQGANK